MDTLNLTFNSSGKTLNLGKDTTITDKDSLLLDAGSGFATYNWHDNSTLQTLLIDGPKVKAGQFVYFVQTTDSSGCSYSDSIKVIITSTVGIADWNKKNLIIYPTPTKENLQIELPSILRNGEIKIINSEGKVVWKQQIKDNTKSKLNIQVSDIPKGLYIIKLETNSEVYKTKMIKE